LEFSIGNPTSATYNGFKLKAKWGKAFKQEMRYEEWEDKIQGNPHEN
jgi:hypothetical protein